MLLRTLQDYLNRRRFRRYFVKPYEAPIASAQAKHKRGVKAARKAQQEHLHNALRGAS